MYALTVKWPFFGNSVSLHLSNDPCTNGALQWMTRIITHLKKIQIILQIDMMTRQLSTKKIQRIQRTVTWRRGSMNEAWSIILWKRRMIQERNMLPMSGRANCVVIWVKLPGQRLIWEIGLLVYRESKKTQRYVFYGVYVWCIAGGWTAHARKSVEISNASLVAYQISYYVQDNIIM